MVIKLNLVPLLIILLNPLLIKVSVEEERSLGIEYLAFLIFIILFTLLIVNVLVSGASSSVSVVSSVGELNDLMEKVPKGFG